MSSPGRGRKEERYYYDDIEVATNANKAYRRVVYTDQNLQLVYMSLEPGVEIGLEIHPHTTQFLRVESGVGMVVLGVGGGGLTARMFSKDMAVVVPPGTRHNVRNVGPDPLKLYTIYSPPEHSPGLVQKAHP